MMQKIYPIATILLTVIGIVVLQFGFIFVLVALLPSIVANYVDNDPGRSTFKIVLACNAAALLPYVMPMAATGLKFEYVDVGPVVTTPHVWLVVYSGAAAGWCLIYLCRYIARFFITLLYEYRTLSMERMQKKLLAEWGREIL